MTLNRRTFVVSAWVCGMVLTPASGAFTQTASIPSAQSQPAAGQNQGVGQEPDPLKRERTDKEKFNAQREVRKELKGAYKNLA